MKNEKRFTKIRELTYELNVSDAMTRDVHTIEPDETINELRIKMRDYKISGMPVCSKNNEIVGIISIEDLIRCLLVGEIDHKVEEKMSGNVRTVYSDEPLIYVVNKFEKYGFGRFPVIDRETKKLVGIITKGDIIKCLLKKLEIDYHEDEIQRYRASHIFDDIISEESSLILRYSVKGGDFRKAGESSSILKKNLQKLNLCPEVIRRVAIASYEAEMNIVIFTPGGEITVEIEKDKVRITAQDEGPGIPDIELAMHAGYSTAPDWVKELGFGAGMGLPNIKNCSDEMKIESKVGEGTNLEFIVYSRK